MKVLILQTARFGDILQTIPLVNALKRKHLNIEIHYLARKRFSSILELTDKVDYIHTLDTQDILSPIVMAPFDEGYNDGTDASLKKLDILLTNLKNENFDIIYNLGFSPFTSYLTHYISQNTDTKVCGYTRHDDGFLNFADDVSSYFYAQVGVGGQNRVHLTDLYASMAGVDYVEEDWHLKDSLDNNHKNFELPEDYKVVHISASQKQKSLNQNQWIDILLSNQSLGPFVLVGAKEDVKLAESISSKINVISLVGKTNFSDLYDLLSHSSGFIGCDSLPMNFCSFTNTICYNISFNTVRFWETGPLSRSSYIRQFRSPEDINFETVKSDLNSIFSKGAVDSNLYYYNGNTDIQRYKSAKKDYDFSWELVKAIYMQEKFPIIDDMRLYDYAQKIGSIINVIVENLEFSKNSQLNDVHLNIISESEAVLHKLGIVCSEFRPLVNWVYTEKIKIPPEDITAILDKTLSTYTEASHVMKVYLGEAKNESTDLVK